MEVNIFIGSWDSDVDDLGWGWVLFCQHTRELRAGGAGWVPS